MTAETLIKMLGQYGPTEEVLVSLSGCSEVRSLIGIREATLHTGVSSLVNHPNTAVVFGKTSNPATVAVLLA